MTKQQKLLAGILGLGGLALAVDRVLVGYDATGPSSVSAMVVDVPQSAGVTAVTTAQAGQMLNVQGATDRRHALAEQLAALGEQHSFALVDLVDAFDPSADWLNADTAEAGAVVSTPKESPQQTFERQHRLEAVFAGGAHQFAVINGRRLSPGQSLDNGALLREVNHRAAIFEMDGRRIELSLSSPHRK